VFTIGRVRSDIGVGEILGIGSTACDDFVPDGVLARLPDHVEYCSLVLTPSLLVLEGRRGALARVGLVALEVRRDPGRDGTGGMSSVGESNFATSSLIEALLALIVVFSAGVALDASVDPRREAPIPEG
jgi:hypothetical protein